MKCLWRRMIVTSDDSELSRLKGKVIFVSFSRPQYPWRRLKPNNYRKVLGTEWDSAVFDLSSAIPANAFPAVAETVKAGGKIVLMPSDKPLEEVYKERGGTGLFGKYLEEAIKLYKEEGECPQWKPPSGLTREQKRALKELDGFLIGRGRALAIIGDRGRGKSALLGAMAAKAVTIHGIRRVEITSPSPEMPSFLKMLDMMLREAKVRFRIERSGEEWRVLGPEWRIEWTPPAKAGGKSGLVMIDEAAAIGVARVVRILKRSWKVILSTTVHGYEGSGKALTKALLESVNAVKVIELKDPVRYPPNDPVERWLNEAFLMKDELVDPGKPLGVEEVEREKVASPMAMRGIASLLALAHYRWEPSDVELMLEHPKGKIFLYKGESGPIGVAFTIDEEPPEDPWSEVKGAALSRLIARVSPFPVRRVSRIAVHPELQRRGFGSELLRALETELTGAIFSNHEVLPFWLKNGYLPIYLSPRYNKITGEKNVAVAKGRGRGEEVVRRCYEEFSKGLLLTAHNVYRDVDPKKIAAMLLAGSPKGLEIEVDEKYLELFLEGKVEEEVASRSLYPCVLKFPELLKEIPDAPLVIGFLIQGKSLWDLAASYERSPEEVKGLLRRAIEVLAFKCLKALK